LIKGAFISVLMGAFINEAFISVNEGGAFISVDEGSIY
jgi:hypothetical protein